jgi:hypothetical protein
MKEPEKVIWCIRALYGLTIVDAALSSFNFDGSDIGIFLAQVGVHFAFMLSVVVSINSAVTEAANQHLRVRFAITIGMSVLKFGSLFVHFVPYASFFFNFLFYAYLIELSFACISP